MLRKLGKRAQTTAEYAILIALVIAAIAAMQIYVKRGMQAQMRDAVDDMEAQMGITGGGGQYEPYYLSSTANTNQSLNEDESMAVGGAVARSSTGSTTADRNQTVGW